MTLRRRLLTAVSALLAVAAVTALLIWAGGRFWDSLDPDYSESIGRYQSGIRALDGVAEVSEEYCRQGDLASGYNCFVRVRADDGLSELEQDALATSIGEVLAAEATNQLRLMAELHVGALTVGLSSTPQLNAERLAIARGLDALAPDDLVAVMWRTQDDDLISDTSNDGLELTVWSTSAADPVALFDSVAVYAAEAVPRGVLTAVVRMPNSVMPDNLYEWGADDRARADWRSVAALPDGLLDADRALVATLSTIGDVRGFAVEPQQVEVVAKSEQLPPAVEKQLADLVPRDTGRQLLLTYLP